MAGARPRVLALLPARHERSRRGAQVVQSVLRLAQAAALGGRRGVTRCQIPTEAPHTTQEPHR
eukprot:3929900-Prymnesium_polylepis.1